MHPLIPYHLRQIADVTECRGNELTLQLVCPCGCDRFTVYQNTDNPEQKQLRADYEAAAGKQERGVMTVWSKPGRDGAQQWYMRRFGHILPERYEPVPCPPLLELQCIAVHCAECGAETVVFDNRFHGYDGAVCGTEIPADFAPLMKQRFTRDTPARHIQVWLRCDVSEEDFADIAGSGADEALLSECFTSMCLYSRKDSEAYRCFFESENA